MSGVTSTNIRVGPGFYLAIKHASERSGLPIGTLANLFLMLGMINVKDAFDNFPREIQSALIADILSTIGDLFKQMGLEVVRNTSIGELYQSLLNPSKVDKK